MSVTITTINGHVLVPTAVKWHIDESEHLHVIDDKGKHIGVFARGQWTSAEQTKTAPTVNIVQHNVFPDSAGDAAEKTARALKLGIL